MLYAFCGFFYIAFRQFRMCKRNREIRSGWIKVCSVSFITKHALLVGDEKQTLGAQPAVYTPGGSVLAGVSLQPQKRLFSWLLSEVSCYFHRKDKCAICVGLSKCLGSIGLEGLGLQDGRWLLQQHRVFESSADQP